MKQRVGRGGEGETLEEGDEGAVRAVQVAVRVRFSVCSRPCVCGDGKQTHRQLGACLRKPCCARCRGARASRATCTRQECRCRAASRRARSPPPRRRRPRQRLCTTRRAARRTRRPGPSRRRRRSRHRRSCTSLCTPPGSPGPTCLSPCRTRRRAHPSPCPTQRWPRAPSQRRTPWPRPRQRQTTATPSTTQACTPRARCPPAATRGGRRRTTPRRRSHLRGPPAIQACPSIRTHVHSCSFAHSRRATRGRPPLRGARTASSG